MNNCFHPLICPICKLPLQQIDRGLKCAQNHAFDIAREGYVNLLPSRKKLAATVGDNAEMLQARRRFLDAGHYAKLSQAINQQVEVLIKSANGQKQQTVILDAGCGEGYYLGQLQTYLQSGTGSHCCLLGMDVSKTAVRYAAKKYRNGRFFVANINTLIPVADQSVNILLNIFAPRNPAEFKRVLGENGRLLIIIPQPNHIQTIRERFDLLQIETDKQESVINRLAPLFKLSHITAIEDSISLTQQSLTDLIQMTPNAHHLTAADWAKLDKPGTFTTQIGFDIMQFIRH